MKIEFEQLEKLSYGKREAFNSLRTNLSFCGEDIKVILFTSCTPDEGKSSTVMELARSIAEDRKRVLMIDADLRKSVMVGRYRAHLNNGKELLGLTHYLTGKAKMEEVILETNVERMDVVLAGRMTPNPTQLLGNHHFEKLIAYARENYDVVLIDSPPLGSVIDTAIMAPQADGAVIVVEAKKCSYRFVNDIQKQLEVTGIRILGVVLNKIKVENRGYYKKYYRGYYKGYYNGYYNKYYGEDEKEKKSSKE